MSQGGGVGPGDQGVQKSYSSLTLGLGTHVQKSYSMKLTFCSWTSESEVIREMLIFTLWY